MIALALAAPAPAGRCATSTAAPLAVGRPRAGPTAPGGVHAAVGRTRAALAGRPYRTDHLEDRT